METPSIFDRGVAKVRSVVSDVSIEQRDFMKAIIRMCQDAWLQGWHEGNGGNLSYRLTEEELASCRQYFQEPAGEWVPFGMRAQDLRCEYFAATAAGSYFRTVASDPAACLGIVEINQTGDAWRSVWGYKGGGRPTSELASHFMVHAVRKAVSKGSNRTVYHAHPSYTIALASVLCADPRMISRALWTSLTECILTVPEGVGVIPWNVPGSMGIAEETGSLMEKHAAIIWPHHGIFCAGDTLDSSFALVQSIEKSAKIYLDTRMALGGAEPTQDIAEAEVRAAAAAFGVTINEAYLDA